MTAFCYPVGLPDSYDELTMELLEEVGCQVGFTFFGGCARAADVSRRRRARVPDRMRWYPRPLRRRGRWRPWRVAKPSL